MSRTGADDLTCTVVICAYTLARWEHLQAAVRSAQSQSRPPVEVLLIIDHEDALLARAELRWSGAEEVPVRVMASRGAPGLSGARNTGTAAARGEIVAFLDDDACADRNWLEHLAAAYDEDSVVAVGGTVTPRWAVKVPSWWPHEFDWVVGCSYTGQPLQRADVRNVIGANMSFRKAAIGTDEGFSEDLGRKGKVPMGCEETDLCIRLRQQSGGRVVYEPAAKVLHHVPAERLTWRYFSSRCLAEGKSKARVAAGVGRADALASENAHARNVLLPAVANAMRQTVSGDHVAWRRAIAISLGLLLAAAGFARGYLSSLDHLGRSAISLIANTVTTSALGVVFWVVAARHYEAAQFGQDAALIAAMILLSSIAQLNLSVGLPRLLPQIDENRWRPVLGAYAAAVAASVGVTAGFLALGQLWPNFAFVAAEPRLALVLVGAVALWSIFALQDSVLISTRLSALVPVESAIFGVVKLVAVVVLAERFGGHGVFGAWVVAMVLLVVPVNAVIFGVGLRRRTGVRPTRSDVLPVGSVRLVGRFLALDYVAALLSQGATALLPLLVVGVLGREANAHFYVAFLIAAAFSSIANAVATAVVAEGAHDESRVEMLVRRAAGWYLLFALPGAIVVAVAAPAILSLFGSSYAEHATALLRLLVVGTLLQAVVTLRVGMERVRGNANRVAAIEALAFLLVVVGAVVGMRVAGLNGLGLGWLCAHAATAAVVAPRSRTWSRRRFVLART